MISPTMHAIAELYFLYKDGHLLTEGAVEQQPAWYITAMQMMKAAFGRAETAMMKRKEEEAKARQ